MIPQCQDDNKSIILNFYEDVECVNPSSQSIEAVISNDACFGSPVDGTFYKYYIGNRIENYELPAYLNETATKDNVVGNFEEMPEDYRAIAVEKYREDYARSLATVSESFMEIKSPSIGADNCFSSVSLYDRSSLFDNTC